jgi:transcription termination factor Rho
LETGDIVEGVSEAMKAPDEMMAAAEPPTGNGSGAAHKRDTREIPAYRLTTIRRINGLAAESAGDRPTPREARSIYERVRPNHRIPLAAGPPDITGRAVDMAAPFARGYAGITHGPHGSGLSRILHHVVAGIRANEPEAVIIVLLLRPRGEEITHWRRSFPVIDVAVCPSGQSGATPEQTLRVADLVLEAAQRQAEMGKHVVLAVDSLTGLWGAMLEVEEADAQREADIALARRRIRDWFQKAGDFTGEGFLGSGLGGSLTIVGTVWSRDIDVEAEEEGETHPHLRLLEHLLPESNWQLALSGELAADRLYPALDLAHSLSRDEENLLDSDQYARLTAARNVLIELPLKKQHERLMEALAESEDLNSALDRIGGSTTARAATFESLRNLLGGEGI